MDGKAPKKAPKRKRKKKTYPSEKKVVCNICGQKYYWECKLAQHMLTHTGEKPYKCPVKKCGKAFNSSYSLKTHSYIHSNQKPFQCSYCPYACRDSSTLRRHQDRHMGIKNKYECKICSKTYNIKATLKLHVAEVHCEMDVRKYACEQCDRRFKTKCTLTLHVKNVHNRARACTCPICGAYMTNKANLPQHLIKHTNQRPYICAYPACEKSYKDPETLKRHARIHYPEQQHSCETCGKMFTRLRRLEHHWKTVHNKRRCVECDYCGQRFYSKSYLINHIQRKHGRKKKRYKCDHCKFVTLNKPSIVMHIKYGHGTENELSKLHGEEFCSSAPPVSSALLSCSIHLPTDSIHEACMSGTTAGSLQSVQSAPPEPRERPVTLQLELPLASQVGAYLQCMSPTEQEEDSLLTLSSVTARPLLAASRKLAPAPPESTADSTAPPDGGYGWVVVLGAFMVQFWVAGLFKSYGVLYVEIMETFPDSAETVASWIPAALSTLCLALAPLSSALCEKYSCRLVVFIGGLFCAAGLALSFLSTQLYHLLLSFGVMTGIGGGLSTTPGIVIVSQYFDKHRALANGICVSGTAAGSFVFPMLIEKLVDTYGLHGTVLLLGGGMLHVCVAATLYRPPPHVRDGSATPPTTTTENTTLLHHIADDKDTSSIKEKENRLLHLFQVDNELTLNQKNNLITEIMHPSLVEVNQVTRPPMPGNNSDSEDSEGLDVLGVVGLPREVAKLRLRPTRSSSILHSVEDLSTDSTCVYKASRRKISRSLYIKPPLPSRLLPNKWSEPVIKQPGVELVQKEVEIKEDKRGCVEKMSRYLDVSLLKDWRFGLLCASVALMSCGSPYALYYLPAYTVAVGHSKSAAGRLVAISAVLDLIGRLGLGWLCDLHLFCRRKAYIISIFVAGISVLTLPSLTNWWALAVVSASYGLCLGCWFLLVPVLLADTFGTARIASSYGLVRMFQSLAAVSVPPTAGLVRDVTGGYSWCFYGMGSCMVLGSIPVLAFHLTTKNEDSDSSVD